MMTQEILAQLQKMAKPDKLEGMARFGMTADKRLGISMPELRKLGKQIGKNHSLALELWKSGIPDARILASLVADPEKLSEAQMEQWVRGINSWDVCDQTCMNCFEKSPYALKKIAQWSNRKEEFVKRTAFSLLACLAWHDKKADDALFIDFLPLIIKHSADERNFVKKAVNWALRNIGKRNIHCNSAAIITANEISCIDSKTAHWIASDALRELTSSKLQKRLAEKKKK